MMEGHLGRKPEELLTDMNHGEAEANNPMTISGNTDRETPPATAFPKTATPIQSSTRA